MAKKLFSFFFFFFFLFCFLSVDKKNINAVGQDCCDSGWEYEQTINKCQETFTAKPGNTRCNSTTEKCQFDNISNKWICRIKPTPIPTVYLPIIIKTPTPAPKENKTIDFDSLRKSIFPTKGAIDLGGNLNLGEIISAGLKIVYVLAGIILLVYLIMAGFQMMIGANDPKAKESAGKSITNAFIGFFILFVSYWVVQIVEVVLGIAILK